MTHSPLRPTVSVKVIETRSDGIRVELLGGGKKGFIRSRELSWERRVAYQPPQPSKGDILEAVTLPESSGGDSLLLSVKKITDPWAEALQKKRYQPGQVVTGEVVNVRSDGIYLQLEPGVDAVLYPKDVPLLRGERIDASLGLGDRVNLKVLGGNNLDKQLVNVSLVEWLQDISRDEAGSQHALLDQLGFARSTLPSSQSDKTADSAFGPAERSFVTPILRHLRRVMIVDDEFEWLEILSKGLQESFSEEEPIEFDTVYDIEEALEKTHNSGSYDLVVIDLHLGDGQSGVSVARALRMESPAQPVLIVSLAACVEDLPDQDEFPFCHKSLDEISQMIDNFRQGFWRTSREQRLAQNGSLAFLLGAEGPVREAFESVLSWLRERTKVSQCILVELDRDRLSGQILASLPALADKDLEKAQNNLFFSPARQVIDSSCEFRENDIEFEYDAKFKNLFRNIDYFSCLGLPVQFPGQPSRHALFLLDENPLTFLPQVETAQITQDAQLAAYFLATIIERSIVAENMRKFEVRYGLGQLLSDLIHEANHESTTLGISLNKLQKQLSTHPSLEKTGHLMNWLQKNEEMIQEVSLHHKGLAELIQSYAREAADNYEPVDVNQVVKEVIRQLGRESDRAEVTFVPDLRDLPPARSIRPRVQQVLFNLALNAIQMLEHKRNIFQMYAEQHHRYLSAPKAGRIIIQTRLREHDPLRPLEIRVIDNGPGIHWQDYGQIFNSGFTRRSGGAGLGLYISRNLSEGMGGRLALVDSIVYLGSAFSLELPLFQASKEE